MTLSEYCYRKVPDYYDTMYLDGFTPDEILYAHRKMMRKKQEERQQEKQIKKEIEKALSQALDELLKDFNK